MSANRLLIVTALLVSGAVLCAATGGRGLWSASQLEELQSLSIAALEPLPADPTNRVADDPRAARLGERLFFDQALSANGKVACGTCHQAERDFQDGIALGKGVGTTTRRTMPIAATSRAPFLFWDGRKDSLWAQALGPLESAVEHGGTRTEYARVIAQSYRNEYEELFGALPDLSSVPQFAGPNGDRSEVVEWWALNDQQRDAITGVFVNIGKAIAAYERRIEFGPSRFDRYADAVTTGKSAEGILSNNEIAGLKLFIGKARCTQCHNGPLFTNNEFHNTGVPALPTLPADDGRLTGSAAVLKDEFNCRSRWSDARSNCAELDYLVTNDHTLERAFKVPSLRNVAARAPFMHAGQFATLAEVLDHYNRAPKAVAGHTELTPLRLSRDERRQLEAFLRTLDGPVLVNRERQQKRTR
ncbi:MAG TPA: cytochrome c peroxidase [Vicinamibacterales bacterium]|nr:cytochrome c peroxidase [Vicinamibacterales bacterium]